MSVLLILAAVGSAKAKTIGTNTPAESITRARIMQLPMAQRSAWLKYLDRSERRRQADKGAFQAELNSAGTTTPTAPPHGFSARSVALDRDLGWYLSADAQSIADNVVSFQTPAGGWGKNLDMSKGPRRPGEKYGPDNLSRFLSPGDFDTPKEPDWNYIGTMIQVMDIMHQVARGSSEYAFVSKDLRDRAAESFERGMHCILATQIVSAGKLTVWAQQYDALTLKPVSARNYEMPAESSGESAELLIMLIDDLPQPTAKERESIRAAVAWFKKTAIYGKTYFRIIDGRGLIDSPGAGPIWARYYQIDTEIPIFGDRDKSIHDDVSELSRERRNGYSWFGAAPERALDHYEKWAQQHPESK